jgi:hypothetical protein
MLLNIIFFLLQKKCENSAAPSNAPKTTTSVSKLKRKLVNNSQSPAMTQAKQAREGSCDKLASHRVEVYRPKRGLVTFDFCPKCLK